MGGAESYRASGEGPGLEGLDSLYPGMLRSLVQTLMCMHLFSRSWTACCELDQQNSLRQSAYCATFCPNMSCTGISPAPCDGLLSSARMILNHILVLLNCSKHDAWYSQGAER